VNVALDLETTGTEPGWHDIVEIGVATPRGDWRSYVRPSHPKRADPVAQRITGIDPARVAWARDLDTVVDELAIWLRSLRRKCGRLTPVVFNWSFECQWLLPLFGETWGDLFSFEYRDAYHLARTLRDAGLIAPNRLTLDACCHDAGFTPLVTHSAIADAKNTLKLYGFYARLLEIRR